MKSPKYIADKKKRKSIFKSSYYRIDDPFYDSFKKIYGDEGLLGYKKERLEAFEDIPYRVENIGGDEMPYRDVVILASQRYKKVNNALTGIKTIAQLAGLIVFFPKYFPIMVESAGGIPIINGILIAFGTIVLVMTAPKIPEAERTSRNYGIFFARLRIARDLGIMDKTASKIMEDDYKGE